MSKKILTKKQSKNNQLIEKSLEIRPFDLKKSVYSLFIDFWHVDFLFKAIFFSSIFLGSLVRFFGLFNTGFYFDMVETQYTWGRESFEMGGFLIFWRDYPINLHFDYPIFSLIYENILYILSYPFGGTKEVFVAYIKIVNWIVEILLIFFISLIGKNLGHLNNNQNIILASFLYLVPSLWFVSGIWGQNDTLITIFAFVVVFLLWLRQEGWLFSYREPKLTKIKKSFEKNQEEEIFREYPFYKDPAFISGLAMAIGVFIKPQPILILPIVILYFFRNKTWKDVFRVLIWIAPYLVIIAIGANLYSDEEIIYRIAEREISNWQILAYLGFFVILLLPLLSLSYSIKKPGLMTGLKRWTFGFFLIFSLIGMPLYLLNYQRFARVTLAPFIRSNEVSFGANNFWSTLNISGSNSQFVIAINNHLGLTVSSLALILFCIFNFVFLYKLFDLSWQKLKSLKLKTWFNKNLSLAEWLSIVLVLGSSYFMFITMIHSRYLHLSLVIGAIYLALKPNIKQIKFFIFIFVIMHLGYFLNQTMIYSTYTSGLEWVDSFNSLFVVNIATVSGLMLVISFLFMFYIMYLNLDKKEN